MSSPTPGQDCESSRQLRYHSTKDCTYILGNISHGQVTCSTPFDAVSPVHLFKPFPVNHVNFALGVQLPLPCREKFTSLVLGTGMVERWEHLVGDASSDVRDEEERVGEG